jgi:plastocyanin
MRARGGQILALLACATCALALVVALALGAPVRPTARHRAVAHHTCRARAHGRMRAARHGHAPDRAPACRSARHAPRRPPGAPTAPGAPAGNGSSGSSGGSSAPAPAGAGAPAPARGEGPQTTPPSIPHIQVTAVEYRFTLSRTTVPHGKVIFEFVNNGQDEHNLNVLPGEGPPAGSFPNAPAKGVSDQEMELRPGTYTLFCSLPEHEQKGMKGTLVVE